MVSYNYTRLTLAALMGVALFASTARAACPFASGLFGSGISGDDTKKYHDHHLRRNNMPTDHHRFFRRMEPDGLLNEGMGCIGHCDRTPGDCDYCGTGQCCRAMDYRDGVEGCELAEGITGSKCGHWRDDNAVPTDDTSSNDAPSDGLLNEGMGCWGHCDGIAGDCPSYCGTGQCCRSSDYQNGIEGCELAQDITGARCGNWRSTNDAPSDDTLSDGLLNEGMGCMGHCDVTPGDCDYCGTGQCCRAVDYQNGVEGCELAEGITGSKCGLWRDDNAVSSLRNEGLSCFGQCDNSSGDCDYCGIGQCCRQIDGERCVPGCELAAVNWIDGPGSQCGYFSSPDPCVPTVTTPPPNDSPPNNDDNDDVNAQDPSDAPNDGSIVSAAPSYAPTGLLNEGRPCGGQCNFTGGPCDYCGSGQCCDNTDWYRGVPGCELAQGQGAAVCGDFSAPYPEPDEFRIGMPLGTETTPQSVQPLTDTEVTEGWFGEIAQANANHSTPEYDGDGGQPWSEFSMTLVRDLILAEIRRASPGTDELSGAKFLRLSFHDCLKYTDGEGGCDGCLNWDMMGTTVGGPNGRTEDREYEDYERKQSNNGLEHAVEFLEFIYNLDFGHTYATGCWQTPATVTGNAHVADTQANPIWVNSEAECHQLCLDTEDCALFTVPRIQFVGGRGPCRLFSEAGDMRPLTAGRLIAGRAECPEHESWSLRSTGKSRADLWAFASLVAVEEGIQRHNYACDGDRRSPHGGVVMCTQFEGEDQCRINPVRPFIFKTGRKDCETTMDQPYQTEKIEAFPDEHFNGTMTVRFMEEHFGFSGKETVAIMGAHTMGRFQQPITGHKYVWTSDFQAFNNQFYRNIAGRPDWFFDDDECTKVGDAWGNKGQAVWIAKMNQVYRTGAPIQWIQKKVVCPNCADLSYERGGRHPERLAQDRDCCLRDVPEGAQCRPDGIGPVGSTAFERDNDFSDGCEYSHFIFANDEAAMGSDMGLMYKFDVDIRGFPSGCPGLQTFYPSADRFSDWTCGIDGRPWFEDPSLAWNDPNLVRETENEWTERGCPADCGRQDYVYPGDEMTLADHVEQYADDQAAWVNDYIPIMEKMIENGYSEDELIVSYYGGSEDVLPAYDNVSYSR